MMETVGIVIVSHSRDIAKGTADMVRQMVGNEVKVLDAAQEELTRRFAGWVLLWPKERSDLAGFGGELDRVMQMPGWTNVWTMPIQNRVDMLSTGVNTAVGIRVLGRKLDDVVRASEEVAAVVRQVPGAADVIADPVRGKGYLEVRVDREKPQPLTKDAQNRCVDKVRELLPQLDAVIFEDYGKGLLQQRFVDEVAALVRGEGKLVTADPNPHNRLIWRGITAVKPNRSEAFAAANKPWHEPDSDPLRDRDLLVVGAELLRIWNPDHLLVTLGEQGMILFDQNKPPFHVPSRAREVYDLSGAGDTAIALFTLALVSGASAVEAAEISNHASSVVVGKLGTATPTPEELLESFRHREG